MALYSDTHLPKSQQLTSIIKELASIQDVSEPQDDIKQVLRQLRRFAREACITYADPDIDPRPLTNSLMDYRSGY